MSVRVLIIEDESLIRWSLRQKFEERNYDVSEAENGDAAMRAIEEDVYDLIMLDYKLPDMTGLDILRKLRKTDQDVVVIMMTAFSSIENAVEAIKLGAFDYLAKPFDMDQLMLMVDKSLETTKLRREVRELRRHLQHEYGSDQIIGQDSSMMQVLDLVNGVARSGATTVFLRGETGTGKDLIAGLIHYSSERATKPFMNITCTAISETLLESELFGHERGAFTDARSQKKGLFELADGGTVFLDEVGDMPPALQAKLLHFLEHRRLRRVGGTTEIPVDVRIIAATNREIEQAIEDGGFRRDLFYRLNVVSLFLPPLRDRGDDVELLTQHFVNRYAKEFKKTINKIEGPAFEKLRHYNWPGNVRELRNVIERAVLLCKGDSIGPSDLVLARNDGPQNGDGSTGLHLPPDGIDFHTLEEQLLKEALTHAGGNQTKAAKLLHLSRDTFRYRLEKHGLL